MNEIFKSKGYFMLFLTYLNNNYFLNCSIFKSEENFTIFRTSQIKIDASSFDRIE